MPAQLLDGAIVHAEAEPAGLSDLLRRVERIERLRSDVPENDGRHLAACTIIWPEDPLG